MSKTDEEIEAQRPDEDAPESEWKKFARLWEQRAKTGLSPEEVEMLKARAAKADELEAAGQTDIERLTARAEEAERRASDAEAKLATYEETAARQKLIEEVAEEKGVSALALRGATREELEEHAEAILALLPKKQQAASDGSGGDRGEDIEGEDASAKEIAESIRI